MADTTRPAPMATGRRISGYCKLDYGHRSCSPGPVMADGVEVLPRHCFCPCHGKEVVR